MDTRYTSTKPSRFKEDMFRWHPTKEAIPPTHLLFLWAAGATGAEISAADRAANAMEKMFGFSPVITCPYRG